MSLFRQKRKPTKDECRERMIFIGHRFISCCLCYQELDYHQQIIIQKEAATSAKIQQLQNSEFAKKEEFKSFMEFYHNRTDKSKLYEEMKSSMLGTAACELPILKEINGICATQYTVWDCIRMAVERKSMDERIREHLADRDYEDETPPDLGTTAALQNFVEAVYHFIGEKAPAAVEKTEQTDWNDSFRMLSDTAQANFDWDALERAIQGIVK